MDLMKRLSDGLISRRAGGLAKRKVHQTFAGDALGSILPLASTENFSKCVADAVAELLDDRITHHPFTYLQFGVSELTSLAFTDDVLRTAGVNDARIVGFDSSGGLVEGELGPGPWRSDLSGSMRLVRHGGFAFDNVDLVQGPYPDTLTPATRARLNLDRADLMVINSDSFWATKLALQFSFPLVGDRSFVIFDDADKCRRMCQNEAFAEVLGEHSRIVAESRPYARGQARVVYLCHCSRL
jgi:hypothetical protein